MKQKNVFLMCGVPGSGKTTWIKNQLAMSNVGGVHISRDEVRFSMIGEDEDYFARENEVFSAFCSKIQEALEDAAGPANVFIDATHLSEKARNKVLDRLDLRNVVNLYAVDFNIPLDICLAQNDLRSGRAFVPKSVVRRMFYQYQRPTENEKYKYQVLTVAPREETENE